VYHETFRSIPKHEGSGDVTRANGDKMRAELRNYGVDADTAEPLIVLAKIKAWSFEHFAQPIKRAEMTNLVLIFKIRSLCKPNDLRAMPDSISEKTTMKMVNDLQFFIELCADRHYRLGAVKSRAQTEATLVWFRREHARVVRQFEHYLRAQNNPG
jgi:hypothetical protein